MEMDWKAFADALEESAKGAELAARQAVNTEQRERAYIASDFAHILLNAVRQGTSGA